MKILLLDDDVLEVPQFVHVWQLKGHTVHQVSDWRELPKALEELTIDVILIDLMIPAIGLPAAQCGGGFTTGEFLYRTYIAPKLPTTPFAVFTSALTDMTVIRAAMSRLQKSNNYRGCFEKGCNSDELLKAISP